MTAAAAQSASNARRGHYQQPIDSESLVRRIDLALVCQRFKVSNFFMHAPHSGRLRFHLGHQRELQSIPARFRHVRLLLHYSVEVFRRGELHHQCVTLNGPFFQQTIEASGARRPNSKIGNLAWRWICPECGDATNLLLARIGQPFTCIDCHGRGGEYVLPATFAALPPEAY